MKILITGATGLIGSQVSRICLDKGYQVNYLTTSKSKIENTPNYQGYYWNPVEDVIDADCLKGVNAIINLVGANIAERWTDAYKKIIVESRTKTTNLLLKTLKNTNENVKSIVSASGIAIYPSSYTKLYTEESTEVGDNFLADVVVKWESAVDQFGNFGLDVAKLRIGLVLAEKEGALPKLTKPVKYYVGAPLGSGRQWQSWIHINDLAHLFVYAVEEGLDGVYNAVTSKPQTNKEITQYIAAVLQKPLWLPNVPSFVLKALLGDMATVVLSSQMASNEKVLSSGFLFEYHNVKRALADLLKKN